MKKYLITSQEFYTDNKKLFAHRLQEQILKHTPDYILYRDKSSAHYKEIAKIFLSIRSEFAGVKAFLHGEVELAFELKADGVHLTSTQFDKIELAKSLGLKVVISSHSYEDVLSAQKLGADYVTYSPIFVSPNKGKPKGVEDLQKLLEKTEIKVFALGGIVSHEQIDLVEESGVYGFASIRHFY